MSRVFIVGCGDIGQRVAHLCLQRGDDVSALTHSSDSAQKLEALGISTVSGDLDRPETLSDLPVADAVIYYLAPPPGSGVSDSRMANFCQAVSPVLTPKKVIYISTSGVYGDCAGAWVDESVPPAPQTDRSRRRLAAEGTLSIWGVKRQVPIVILRVPGIYGPGRLPLDRVRQGMPVLRESESPWTNRIHADDLAQVCVAAAEKGQVGDIFNVSDGQPGTMTEYFNAVAAAFGLPLPLQVSMEEARSQLSPALLSYLSESRRLDNRRMLQQLGVVLRYPDLASGLAAIREMDV